MLDDHQAFALAGYWLAGHEWMSTQYVRGSGYTLLMLGKPYQVHWSFFNCLWVIPGQINTKNGATSQILAKLGENIHYHKLLFDIKF